MNLRVNRWILFWVLCTFLLFFLGCTKQAPKTVSLTVSAAASLKDALEEIKELYLQEQQEIKINYNFGSSGALQRQIEQGAPVDVFIAASLNQLDELEKKGLLLGGSRKSLLGNKVILIVPKGTEKIKTFADLARQEVGKIAIGDPASVPAGLYAKEALTFLDLWAKVQEKLVLAKDVRQVLSYVEAGHAEAGIVYLTDAMTSEKVELVAQAPEQAHTPVLYPVAIIKSAQEPEEAKKFLQFLDSPPAKSVFKKYGFTVRD